MSRHDEQSRRHGGQQGGNYGGGRQGGRDEHGPYSQGGNRGQHAGQGHYRDSRDYYQGGTFREQSEESSGRYGGQPSGSDDGSSGNFGTTMGACFVVISDRK